MTPAILNVHTTLSSQKASLFIAILAKKLWLFMTSAIF